MNIDLRGKTAVVCGSTQGIGKAVAIQLADAGAHVTLVARNEEMLIKTKSGLASSSQQQHDYLVADFSFPDKLKNIVSEYVKKNQIHILVNNTGGPKAGPVRSAATDEFENAFRNHLICNHILAQCCIEGMTSAKYGRIINIISTSVKQPLKGLGVSNTIRAAVANWSKTLAGEVAQLGITVNNVLPGATATSRLSEIITNKSVKSGMKEDDVKHEMLAEIPAGRFAQPEEIASAVTFLASPAASYITGINVPVDGGRTLCL